MRAESRDVDGRRLVEKKGPDYRGRIGMGVTPENVSSQELMCALCSFSCGFDALEIETGPDVKHSSEINDRRYQKEKQRENESQFDERLSLAMGSTHEALRNGFPLVIMHHAEKCKWGSKKRRSDWSGASR